MHRTHGTVIQFMQSCLRLPNCKCRTSVQSDVNIGCDVMSVEMAVIVATEHCRTNLSSCVCAFLACHQGTYTSVYTVNKSCRQIMNVNITSNNVSPNSKQPFSRAEDCEQFCHRSGDRFMHSGAVVTVNDQVPQTLHQLLKHLATYHDALMISDHEYTAVVHCSIQYITQLTVSTTSFLIDSCA